jgi:hypothetical protein
MAAILCADLYAVLLKFQQRLPKKDNVRGDRRKLTMYSSPNIIHIKKNENVACMG